MTHADRSGGGPADAAERRSFFGRRRVLFLYPEVATASSFSVAGKHLGASYVRAHLEAHGVPSAQFVAQEPLALRELVDRIADEAPAVLGVTVYDCTYHTVKMLLRELKARRPELLVVLGGPTPTFSDRLVLDDLPEADLCVRGEGEEAALELLEAFRQGGDYSGVAGVTYRRRGGEVVRNPDRPLVRGEGHGREIDVLASPYLSGILTPADGRQAGILSSRGCAFRCVYCNFAAMSRWTVRFHSVERVLAELSYIASGAAPGERVTLTIQDDAFTLNKPRAKEICRRILEARLPLRVDCETRADAVDDELLELMQRAGFGDLHFGVESGSPRVLRAIKKAPASARPDPGFEAEKAFLGRVRRAVKKAGSLGLRPTVSIILGLPTETLEDGLESVRFVASLDPCRYYHNYLEVFAGTELFDTHADHGIGVAPVVDRSVSRVYRTRHAYDVATVPPVPGRSVFDGGCRGRELSARLCGDRALAPPPADGRHPSLVVFADAFPSAGDARWFVAHASTAATRLAVLSQRAEPDGAALVHELFMPVQSLYWLAQREPDGSAEALRRRACEDLSENLIPHRFEFHDVRHFGAPRAAAGPEPTQRVFQVVGEGGWPGLSRRVDALVAVARLAQAGLAPDAEPLDACRWSDAPCPAARLDRVVVDGGGNLFPCFTGCAVGSTREPLDAVRRRIARVGALARATRGCDRCPARDACSRCLFPHPLGVNGYCALQLARWRAGRPLARCA